MRLFPGLSSLLRPSRVLDVLRQRKLLNDSSRLPESTGHAEGSSVYVGFDPTADSLHVGNLVTVMAMLHFQQAGYRPLAVVGGATGAIGDPSGRSKERNALSDSTLQHNLTGISKTLQRIFHNAKSLLGESSSQPEVRIINNADWYRNMHVIEFMSKIGRYFQISAMLNKTSVKLRMDTQEGLSFTEFSYQVFQAYDFLSLHQEHNCCIQIGGGDQWGNITAGIEFVRKYTGEDVYGVTVPLVTTSSGEKIGKSAGNAVWLSPEKTSPYQLYQYFVRTSDQDVERFLHYYTFTSTEDISSIMRAHCESPENFHAQKYLAEQVTKLVHGSDGLRLAKNATAALFGDKDALHQLPEESVEQLFEGAPSTALSRDQCSSMSVVDLMMTVKATDSKAKARRLIYGGGVYLNQVRVASPLESISLDQHLLCAKLTILRIGKKDYHIIQWV